ncbi:hypothetical protein L838_4709 [Mycobacterium avium MAV_120709_2344]|uniref:Uncharacterized protein n=1 Tax=Mycobacterium avium (strain 104) TaxID=243243 RepID=A0A0H2ZU35_MYCA1|nr:hypothetical protein MAV_2077 [Mycobacterium avium 104]ETZ41806.1 hypothetical protein L838_4709 [Mycobacterium avium MAV_120709_2344]ETZ43392.1 hypothetical protein L839_3814 [Mycobacterium avium MAV_120809_2495]ETZ45719.1 hypothetical protein L837_2224 [Mycobacterium avium MAV_061107_1842]
MRDASRPCHQTRLLPIGAHDTSPDHRAGHRLSRMPALSE